MSEDKLGFLSGAEPAEVEEPTPEPQPSFAEATEGEPEPEPPAQDRPRGPDGKVLAREPEPDAVKPTGQVPISAMLDERDKRQKLERELAALREAQAPQEPPSQDEVFGRALYQQNLRVSRKFAERQYGAETVAKVHDWAEGRCNADPIFNQQMSSSDDPYEAAMQAFNRERVLETVKPERLDAFLAWEAAQKAAPTPPNPSPPPPRSLANAPGNGAMGRSPEPEVGEGVAFRSVIRS